MSKNAILNEMGLVTNYMKSRNVPAVIAGASTLLISAIAFRWLNVTEEEFLEKAKEAYRLAKESIDETSKPD